MSGAVCVRAKPVGMLAIGGGGRAPELLSRFAVAVAVAARGRVAAYAGVLYARTAVVDASGVVGVAVDGDGQVAVGTEVSVPGGKGEASSEAGSVGDAVAWSSSMTTYYGGLWG